MITTESPILGSGGSTETDDPDDLVFIGEPLSRRPVRLRIVGRRKGEPFLCADDFDEGDE